MGVVMPTNHLKRRKKKIIQILSSQTLKRHRIAQPRFTVRWRPANAVTINVFRIVRQTHI
jgi:hypothetical protein